MNEHDRALLELYEEMQKRRVAMEELRLQRMKRDFEKGFAMLNKTVRIIQGLESPTFDDLK